VQPSLVRVRQAVDGLRRLRRACIDASTIIYAHKAGFLRAAAEALDLMSTERVLSEAGYQEPLIRPVREGPDMDRLSADEGLVAVALDLGVPVISDDKRILIAAKAGGLDRFNAVMVLHLLYLRGRISIREHAECQQSLREFAWYSGWIWEFGRQCFDLICHEV
jgi:hypothetical protein